MKVKITWNDINSLKWSKHTKDTESLKFDRAEGELNYSIIFIENFYITQK